MNISKILIILVTITQLLFAENRNDDISNDIKNYVKEALKKNKNFKKENVDIIKNWIIDSGEFGTTKKQISLNMLNKRENAFSFVANHIKNKKWGNIERTNFDLKVYGNGYFLYKNEIYEIILKLYIDKNDFERIMNINKKCLNVKKEEIYDNLYEYSLCDQDFIYLNYLLQNNMLNKIKIDVKRIKKKNENIFENNKGQYISLKEEVEGLKKINNSIILVNRFLITKNDFYKIKDFMENNEIFFNYKIIGILKAIKIIKIDYFSIF